MNTVFELPMLYGMCKTGKTKIYKVSVVDNGDGSLSVLREHGQLGGKTQTDEKRIAAGKNLGRANATSVMNQAIAEARAYHQKKLDKNYTTTQNVQAVPKANLLPMLAKSFKDSGHRIKFPCYGQAKFNGVRCLAKRTGNEINFWSRQGKSYNDTLGHLIPSLLCIMKDGEVFDGEIYIHGKSLQTIVSYVKKLRPESKQLRYFVYDVADPTKIFENRYATYSSIIPENPYVVAVQCIEVKSVDEIQPIHNGMVQDGYEGLILRNKNGLYEFDHRSENLQKFKMFEDHEYKIIGGRTPDTGRYSGGCIFLCEVEPGKTFEVAPRGTAAIRQQYYTDLPKLLNKMLTVRHFGFSDSGVPLMPVGIVIRDYET